MHSLTSSHPHTYMYSHMCTHTLCCLLPAAQSPVRREQETSLLEPSCPALTLKPASVSAVYPQVPGTGFLLTTSGHSGDPLNVILMRKRPTESRCACVLACMLMRWQASGFSDRIHVYTVVCTNGCRCAGVHSVCSVCALCEHVHMCPSST